MAKSPSIGISSRKQPKQARSNELVSAVLEAAARVLAAEGAHRFTTARVAEKAGVSVGSLYQYFPNKASILFRLQSDEWQRTTALLRRLLENRDQSPFDRLRALVHAFILSECEEADLRVALADAAPLYRDAPETGDAKGEGDDIIQSFIDEILPQASLATRTTVAELIGSTFASVGKDFSEEPRTPAEIAIFSDAMADMFCAYLRHLQTP